MLPDDNDALDEGRPRMFARTHPEYFFGFLRRANDRAALPRRPNHKRPKIARANDSLHQARLESGAATFTV